MLGIGCILRLIPFDAYHPTPFCLGLFPKIDHPPLINFLTATEFNRWLWLYYHFLLFDIFEHDFPFGFLLSFSFSCPIISHSITGSDLQTSWNSVFFLGAYTLFFGFHQTKGGHHGQEGL
jgi:hypothetical protein